MPVPTKTLPTQQTLIDVFVYEPDTGYLTWCKPSSARIKPGARAGAYHNMGYIAVGFRKKSYLAHRLIYKLVTGEEPGIIDHINHIRHDNRWANLRICSPSENSRNRLGTASHSRSGIRGVYRMTNANTWHATVGTSGKEGFRRACFADCEYGSKQAALDAATVWVKGIRASVFGTFEGGA